MSLQSVRTAIIQYDATPARIDRAPYLAKRIKIETRWLLLTKQHNLTVITQREKTSFIARWPSIRKPGENIDRHFYEIAADHAATFAALIVARRQVQGHRRQ
jgi:hypothetical protein